MVGLSVITDIPTPLFYRRVTNPSAIPKSLKIKIPTPTTYTSVKYSSSLCICPTCNRSAADSADANLQQPASQSGLGNGSAKCQGSFVTNENLSQMSEQRLEERELWIQCLQHSGDAGWNDYLHWEICHPGEHPTTENEHCACYIKYLKEYHENEKEYESVHEYPQECHDNDKEYVSAKEYTKEDSSIAEILFDSNDEEHNCNYEGSGDLGYAPDNEDSGYDLDNNGPVYELDNNSPVYELDNNEPHHDGNRELNYELDSEVGYDSDHTSNNNDEPNSKADCEFYEDSNLCEDLPPLQTLQLVNRAATDDAEERYELPRHELSQDELPRYELSQYVLPQHELPYHKYRRRSTDPLLSTPFTHQNCEHPANTGFQACLIVLLSALSTIFGLILGSLLTLMVLRY